MQNDVVIELDTLGGLISVARAVNDKGIVVGYSHNERRRTKGFLYDGSWLESLGTLGGNNSYALDINNQSQIVGFSFDGSQNNRAFLFEFNQMGDLGDLGGQSAQANAINDNGVVVGISQTLSGSFVAFVLQGGNMEAILPVSDDDASYAVDINNFGDVVGYSHDHLVENANGTISHRDQHVDTGFLWMHSNTYSLSTLGGVSSYANAINDQRYVVGWAYDDDDQMKATYWYEGEVYDLNRFLTSSQINSCWVLTEAMDINNYGYVVGEAKNRQSGYSSAFLLSPVSTVAEPGFACLFIISFFIFRLFYNVF